MSASHDQQRAPVEGHYTFGDNATAAERLQFLADLFRPSLESFVRAHAHLPVEHALDLGCGPGHTTTTLASLLSPSRITGFDHSERFLAEAEERLAKRPPDASGTTFRYLRQDVTAPLEQEIAPQSSGAEALPDLIYARFLLTHLPQPAQALRAWAGYGRPGATVLVQETASMGSAHPALARYYELVGELQRRHGQRLDIGRGLAELVDARLYRISHAGTRAFTLPGPDMARLHRMNLSTWRTDPMASSFDQEELTALHAALTTLSQSPARSAEVNYAMGELVLTLR